jgi:hypothetical protein
MDIFKLIVYAYLALQVLADLTLGVIIYHQSGGLWLSIAIMALPFSLSVYLLYGLVTEKLPRRYGRPVSLYEPAGFIGVAFLIIIHIIITGMFMAGAVEKMGRGPYIPITFVGMVKSIEPLGEQELRGIPVDPVDFDSRVARFAVTVHIESVTPGQVAFERGTDQVFSVHEPIAVFGPDAIGKKYRFEAGWNEEHRGSMIFNLKASQILYQDTR